MRGDARAWWDRAHCAQQAGVYNSSCVALSGGTPMVVLEKALYEERTVNIVSREDRHASEDRPSAYHTH